MGLQSFSVRVVDDFSFRSIPFATYFVVLDVVEVQQARHKTGVA